MAHVKAQGRPERCGEPAPAGGEAAPARSAVRVPHTADPDHHLWRNGRLWWVAFTVHRGYRQERVRHSLHTEDVAEARRRRDRALEHAARDGGCEVSLRFVPRRRRSSEGGTA